MEKHIQVEAKKLECDLLLQKRKREANAKNEVKRIDIETHMA